MVLVDPVCRVGQKEFPHRTRVLAIEIDRLAPLVRVAVGEVLLGKLLEVVAIGSEMVVDDVEDHAQTEPVGAVDEAAKVVRLAVEPRGREQVYAIVAPAEAAGK